MKKLFFILFLAIAAVSLGPPRARADVAANAGRDVYTGNGSSTAFVYTFKILTQNDIAVYVAGVLKTISTDYTVAGVGNDNGGTLTFTTAPANGAQVLFLRNQAIEQNSTYVPGSISASQIERDFDRQTAVDQQQQEQLNRAIQLDRTVTGVTTAFTPEAGKCFGLNAGGTAVTNFDCEGGVGGDGDITDVLGTTNEITITNSGGPSPQVGISSTLNLSTKVLQGGTPLVFEGATDNTSETSVVVTDPTADRTFTIPNADSVAVQPSTAGSNQFATGVSAAGVVAYTQPQFSNLSGTATRAQLPSQVAYEDEPNTFTGNVQVNDEDGFKIVDGADATRVARFSANSISSAATRTLTIPNQSGTLALTDQAQTFSGANTFSVDQTWGTGARAILGNLGLRGTASDTNPACAAGDYTIYADLSESKWKQCDNGVLSDLGSGAGASSQHSIDAVNLSANDPINFQDTATIDWTNPSAGNVQAAIKATSITDAMIAAAGITTRSKLPAEVGYEDEQNTWSNTQTFTTPPMITGGTVITLEGATADDFETSIVVTDPTADRTITLPNASGEVSLLGQTISGAEMDNNTVGPTQIDETANYTWSGTHDFGSSASVKVPTSAGAAPTTSGHIAYDSTSNTWEAGVNGGNKTFVFTDGNVATATALAANGANCSAGSFPLGVDASGAAESCTDAATQTELDAHLNDAADAHDASAISNVAAGSIAATDVQAAINELDAEKLAVTAFQSNAPLYCVDAGSTDDYVCSVTPALTAYTAGMVIYLVPNTTNSGAATINIDSLGATNIIKLTGDALADSDLVENQPAPLFYDGASFRHLREPTAASPIPGLSTVAGVDRFVDADCANPVKVRNPLDSTDYLAICWDATDGPRIIPYVNGVADAANKRVILKDGFDWCVADNDGTCIFKLTEAGVFSGSAIKKSVQVELFDPTTDNSTGDGKRYFRVPSTLDGYTLTAITANVITAGTTGTVNVDLARCVAAATGNVCSSTVADMLSTNLTIDSGENSSSTAATAAVIDTANDDVSAGQIIRFDVDAVHTTPAKGLIVDLVFTAP